MDHHLRALVARSIMILSLVAACSATAPSAPVAPGSVGSVAPPSTLPSPAGAASFQEFTDAACSALGSLEQAIGNPDSGVWSRIHKELDQAVEARDGPAARRLAESIASELEAGRRQAAAAAAYPSARPMMAGLDQVLAAFLVMVAAKRDAANGLPATVDPQTAFERAGGVDAWRAMVEGIRAIERPAGEPPHQCPNAPVNL